MLCTATKKDGSPCVFKALPEYNYEYCGIHRNYFTPEPEALESDVIDNLSNKEDNNMVEIFHYQLERPATRYTPDNAPIHAAFYPRYITTELSGENYIYYRESQRIGRPVKGVLAISTGKYRFSLLENLAQRGLRFEVMSIPNKGDGGLVLGLAEMKAEHLELRKAESNFYWANATNTFFIKFPGYDGWGLEPMGIKTKYVKKLSKRMAEVVRLTRFSLFRENMDGILMSKFNWAGDEKEVDGCIFISRKLFFSAIVDSESDPRERQKLIRRYREGDLCRLEIRIETETQMLKGHCIVMDELPGGRDILYHESAAKAELSTNGYFHMTLEPYATHHSTVYDLQSIINNRNFLPEAKQLADLKFMKDDAILKATTGELPEWLYDHEKYHGSDAVDRYGEEFLADYMARQYIKPQQFNIAGTDKAVSPWTFANLTYMVFNGIIERFRAQEIKDEQRQPFYYKKYWTPVSNAFSAPVITHELLSVAGIRVGDPTKVVYHKRYGIILPGKRFVETYDLHGGFDLDDSLPCYLVKIWSSDENRVQFLKDWKALDERFEVPSTKEEAVWAMVIIRRPNGPGEYSVEMVTDPSEFDWYRFDESLVPVVDLNDKFVSDPATYLVSQIEVRGMPQGSLTFTGEPMTREQASAMIHAQMLNPGVGGIASALMQWANCVGVSYPPKLLANLEDMVDEIQQGHDPHLFEAIADEVINVHEMLVEQLLNNDSSRSDRILGHIYKIGRNVPTDVRHQINKRQVEGRFTRFNAKYIQTWQQIRQEIVTRTYAQRSQQVLPGWTLKLQVRPETMKWAAEFYAMMDNKFQANDAAYHHKSEGSNRFVKMHLEKMRTDANRTVVDEAVQMIRNMDQGNNEHYKRILVLWKYILMPGTTKMTKNRSDRLLCAPGHGESLMDLLLEALVWQGWITKR